MKKIKSNIKKDVSKKVKNSFTKLCILSAVSLSFMNISGMNVLNANEVNTHVHGPECNHETHKIVDHFADNGIGNVVALEQSPAGVHANGITYISYQGRMEDPYVAAYNHETGEWQGPIKAGFSELGKDTESSPTGRLVDNHGKPTMLIDDLGYIHLFFGGHGGSARHGENPLGDIHDGRNKHVVSKNPHDISEWVELDTLPPFGNYNQAVKMDNGDIYLFYRHGAHESDWVYQKSTDHGRTFEEAVSVLQTNKRSDIDAKDSWYLFVRKGENDKIMLAYDYHTCWATTANGDRGHTTQRNNVYYMSLDTKTGELNNIKGEKLALPVTRDIANKKTLAVDTGDKWTFGPSVALGKDGNPYLRVSIGTDIGKKTGGPKQDEFFRWDGKKWIGSGETVNPQARIDGADTRGDFFVDEKTGDITFAIGYKETNKDGVISYYTSSDQGETFTKSQELMRRKNTGFAVSAQIENAHPDARFIVGQRKRGQSPVKVFLVGDNGPIEREIPVTEEEL